MTEMRRLPKVVVIENRGRCYISQQNYSKGDVIIEEEPYALVIKDKYIEGYILL